MNNKFETHILESLLKASSPSKINKRWITSITNIFVFALLAVVFSMTANSKIPIKMGLVAMAILGFFAGTIFLYKQHAIRTNITSNFYDADKIKKRINEIKT